MKSFLMKAALATLFSTAVLAQNNKPAKPANKGANKDGKKAKDIVLTITRDNFGQTTLVTMPAPTGAEAKPTSKPKVDLLRARFRIVNGGGDQKTLETPFGNCGSLVLDGGLAGIILMEGESCQIWDALDCSGKSAMVNAHAGPNATWDRNPLWGDTLFPEKLSIMCLKSV